MDIREEDQGYKDGFTGKAKANVSEQSIYNTYFKEGELDFKNALDRKDYYEIGWIDAQIGLEKFRFDNKEYKSGFNDYVGEMVDAHSCSANAVPCEFGLCCTFCGKTWEV